MAALLFVAFVVVPLVEIWVIIQVGSLIGGWPTVLLLLLDSLLGAWLLRREGLRTWGALRDGIGRARMPGRELADAALVLVGGTLLLTPGFVTDAVGFFLVLPPTRPVARRVLLSVLARRVSRAGLGVAGFGAAGTQGGGGGSSARPPRTGGAPTGPRVVPGEVVEPDQARDDETGPETHRAAPP